MRGRACAALIMALAACGDDDDKQPVTDASVRFDARTPGLDAALIETCGAVTACQSGALTQLPQLCIGSSSAQPSGDLWKICLIDPQGRTSYIQIRADQRITSPGWTYSNYAFVDGTLSDEGYDACLDERSKLMIATVDNQPDASTALCYRAASGNDDD